MNYSIEQLRTLVIPPDTTPQAAWVQMNLYRRMSPELHLELALAMNDTARAVSAAGVRARHHDYDEDQVRLEVIRMCLGDELFCRAFRAN